MASGVLFLFTYSPRQAIGIIKNSIVIVVFLSAHSSVAAPLLLVSIGFLLFLDWSVLHLLK